MHANTNTNTDTDTVAARSAVRPAGTRPWMRVAAPAFGLASALAFALGTPLVLTGCNTTEGVGEDLSAVGDAIDDAAEDARD